MRMGLSYVKKSKKCSQVNSFFTQNAQILEFVYNLLTNSRFPPSLQSAHIPKETERGPHDGRWEGHRGNTVSAAPWLALSQLVLV